MCLTGGILTTSSTQLRHMMREEYWHPTRKTVAHSQCRYGSGWESNNL